MATCIWTGNAAAVRFAAQIQVYPGSGGDTSGITVNGKDVLFTQTGTQTNDELAAALAAAVQAAALPELADYQFAARADGSGVVDVTGPATPDPRGGLITDAGTYTPGTSVVTAATGPNFYDNPANWSGGAVPVAGDTVIFDGGPDCLYNLPTVTAAYAEWRVTRRQQRVGLPRFHPRGFLEYLTIAPVIDPDTPVVIGEGDGTGPVRCNLVFVGAGTTNVQVINTGQSEDVYPAVNVRGSGTAGTVGVSAGSVGLAALDPSTTITVATLKVTDDAVVSVGPGATVTTVDQTTGTVWNGGAVTTLSLKGGRFVHTRGTVTTVVADGGVFDWRTGGTVATGTFRGRPGVPPPVMDAANDTRTKTLTNGSFVGGAYLNDPGKTVVMSNPVTFDDASAKASTLGAQFTLLRA